MTKTSEERAEFWKFFHEVLAEKGNPFIQKESENQYVMINREDTNFRKTSLTDDFLLKDKIFRASLYIPNDTELYEKLNVKRVEIEEQLGFQAMARYGKKIAKRLDG